MKRTGDHVILNKRPCGPLKSAKNPDAYTKPELVLLAMKKFSITKSAADKLTKDEICKSLEKGKLVDKKTSKTRSGAAKAKKATAKKATAKKAATAKKTVKAKVATKKVSVAKKTNVKKVKPKKTLEDLETEVSPKKEDLKPQEVPAKKIKKIKLGGVKIKKGPCIERSNLPLKEHQRRVVEHIRKNRGLIVAHSVGSGKTLTAVTASQCFLEDYPNGKIIVVTPVSLQDNFKKEMRAYGANPDSRSYLFYTLQGFATEYNKKQCGTAEEPIMLIIDEAHNLRTDIKAAKRAAKKREVTGGKEGVVRADVAVRCAKTATKVLLMTATTVYNNPNDIINLIAMAKGIDPPTKKEFELISSDPYAFYHYFKCMISFYDLPTDKAHGYPDVDEHYVEIPMTEKYFIEYSRVENQNSDFFSEKNPWRFLTGMRQASNALEKCPKCDWVLEKAKEGKKMVIYSAFLTYGVEKMKEVFDQNGIEYREVTGKMKQADRSRSVDDYNTEKVKVLFITKAGGEGLDLKETRYIIIFESSWNRPNELQIIGRGARYHSHINLPDNEQKVDVYHLIMVKPRTFGTEKSRRDFEAITQKPLPSADEMLRIVSELKEKENESFTGRLHQVSIERQQC